MSVDAFRKWLLEKPFCDARCDVYLMDVAQIMSVLPPPPAKLLDLGCGSGWTSELFARRGYQVLGIDISADMIDIAKQRIEPNLEFAVCDYEANLSVRGFDAAVIYDALHSAEDEEKVQRSVYGALADGGVIVTIEPGVGHSMSEEALEVSRKYGTTEKDMPYLHTFISAGA